MRKLVVVCGMLSLPGVALAGDKPLYQPAPTWVKPVPALPTGATAPALLVFDQQQRLEGDEVWAYSELATRITSEEVLAQAGTIKIMWQPDDGDLIVHRAAIVRDGATVDLLKGEGSFTVLRREAQLEALMVDGVLTAMLAAEGLRVGDVLRIAYSVRRRDRALKGKVQTLVPLIGAPIRVGFARARLLWKPELGLSFRSHARGVAPTATMIDGYREVEVALPLAKPDELPDDIPARLRPLPLLEAGNFADWAAVSQVMAPLYRTAGLAAAEPALTQEAAKIAAASTDPRTRAAAALRLVQDQVRYLARGMEGGNYLPQSPARTWAARYGDCKAKTLLLLTLLRELGIEAEAVLVNSALGDAVPKRQPLPAAFDHVIVRATIDGRSLWLDGTRQGDRLADIDDVPPFVWGLPIRDSGSEPMRLPYGAPARAEMAVAIDLDQSAGPGLPSLYRTKIVLRGGLAGMLATAADQVTAEQRKDMVQGIVARVVDAGELVEHALIEDKAAGTVTVTGSGVTQSGWRTEDKRQTRVLDRVVSDIGFEPDRARIAWRELPVTTAAPSRIEFSQRIILPLGGRGFSLDGDTRLPDVLAGARLSRSAAIENGVIRTAESIAWSGAEIAPADVAATRAAVALAKTRLLRVVAPADYPARWQVVTTARRSGAFKPLEAIYAKAIAADPKSTRPLVNRAAFREGIYDWRGALPDLSKAIALEPSADLYVSRARAHEYSGNIPAAIADAEQALALAPDSLAATSRLAWLKGTGGKLDEALAMNEEKIAAGGENRFFYLNRKAEMLVLAGRGADAVAVTDTALVARPGNASACNSRCWTKATANLQLDTALKDCSRAIELGESPSAAFDSRALVYFRLGRLDEALEDVTAALDLSPDTSGSLFLRGVVRTRKGDVAGAGTDFAAARMIDPRVDAMYARWGVVP